jgi:hypothetical protein
VKNYETVEGYRSPPVLLLMVVALLLTACGQGKFEWKEEVKLQSGEVVVVKRTAKSKPFGEIGGAGGWENEGMTVQIIQPLKADNPPLWDAKFVPLVFDRDPQTKEWFMVATFVSCTSWYELGRPKLPYTEYRVKNGQWRQQALSPNLIGREGNMLTTIHSTGEPDHTISSKEGINNDPAISPEYKRVVRNWTTGC